VLSIFEKQRVRGVSFGTAGRKNEYRELSINAEKIFKGIWQIGFQIQVLVYQSKSNMSGGIGGHGRQRTFE